MEEPKTEMSLDRSLFAQQWLTISSDRDDGLGDRWPSTVDLTTNGSAPNPLAGSVYKASRATEARALSMIKAQLSRVRRIRAQCVLRPGPDVQKKLSTWNCLS